MIITSDSYLKKVFSENKTDMNLLCSSKSFK